MIPKSRETQHILLSREASIRAKEKEDKHIQQGVDMRARWVETNNLMRHPVDMAQALSKVRTSSVSIPDELSRYQGTTIYNAPPAKP
jgi:hypothetical protein